MREYECAICDNDMCICYHCEGDDCAGDIIFGDDGCTCHKPKYDGEPCIFNVVKDDTIVNRMRHMWE